MQTHRKLPTPDVVAPTASDLTGKEDRLAVLTEDGVRLAAPGDIGPFYVIHNVTTAATKQEAEMEALQPGVVTRVVADGAVSAFAFVELSDDGMVISATSGSVIGHHESDKPASAGGLVALRPLFALVNIG